MNWQIAALELDYRIYNGTVFFLIDKNKKSEVRKFIYCNMLINKF